MHTKARRSQKNKSIGYPTKPLSVDPNWICVAKTWQLSWRLLLWTEQYENNISLVLKRLWRGASVGGETWSTIDRTMVNSSNASRKSLKPSAWKLTSGPSLLCPRTPCNRRTYKSDRISSLTIFGAGAPLVDLHSAPEGNVAFQLGSVVQLPTVRQFRDCR